MNKYKTVAYEVKSEINSLLEVSSVKNRPWQLLNFKLMSRTLLTTYEELGSIYRAKASERFGFEISDDLVYTPSLFVKLSGSHIFTTELDMEEEESANDLVLRFNSISDFNRCDENNTALKPSQVQALMNSDGLLDKVKILESPVFKYRFLKREYQELIIDKINCIISERNNLFYEYASRHDPLEIASVLLSIDQNIISMFNNFDFMNMVPKVIIKNEDKGIFSNSQAYVLALLNQLSYDIVIISENGYADIENVILENNFLAFYGIKKDSKVLKNKKADKLSIAPSKLKKIAVSALAIAAVFAGGILLNNAAIHIKDYTFNQIRSIASGFVQFETLLEQNVINPIISNPIRIVSITPAGPLKAGVETEFKVVVDYDLKDLLVTGKEKLTINVGANDGKSVSISRFFTENIPTDQSKVEERYYVKNSVNLTKDKLKGRYTIGFRATPVKWNDYKFQIQIGVSDMSVAAPRKVLTRDRFIFDIEK